MRRLGVIARADDGGLGNQTRELIEHLGPEVVLCVVMGGNARGAERVQRVRESIGRRFPEALLLENAGPKLWDDTISAALNNCDVLYTIEGPYHPELFQRCEAAGVELVIHANPELYREYPCHRLLIPTPWRTDRMPGSAELLPFPVNAQRLQPSPPAAEPTYVHLTGPAMLDRQGTELLLASLRLIEYECRVLIRRADAAYTEERVGAASVVWLPPADNYWEAIPDGCWALIQPRRYGGLSLCIQEAAARGLPTISLDRDPESSFYSELTIRVPLIEEQPHSMAGGHIGVADAAPSSLAEALDRLSFDGPMPAAGPRAWAEAHSWEALLPSYEQALRSEPVASLEMPFVVCSADGRGPYDDEAFSAGYQTGELHMTLLQGGIAELETQVRTATLPQLDLIAMRSGFSLTAEPLDDAWSHVRFLRLEADELPR